MDFYQVISNRQKHFREQKYYRLLKEKKIITKEKDLVENFNDSYINIVVKSSRKNPKNFFQGEKNQNIQKLIRKIVKSNKNDPTI